MSACTSDTLLVSYATAYSASGGGGSGTYDVANVTVSDTAPTPIWRRAPARPTG